MTYSKPEVGKPIVVEIGERLLELRYSLKTLKALDVEHHISVLKGQAGEAFQDPEKMALVLYYGLRAKNPDITLDWVEENIDASMLIDLAPVLAYATTGRWPDMDRILGESPNGTRLKLTGSQFGPLEDTTSHLPSPNSGD